ncbi:MAG: hypothetical protein GC159_01865 [Phycisphaera sp.]|nr:hypothetical protein [Phycisphaera sp.]
MRQTAWVVMWVTTACAIGVSTTHAQDTPHPPAKYPARLVESLKFGDEYVEVTEAGTLRRRYRVWGDYDAELAAWKKIADDEAAARAADPDGAPRVFRIGCVFLKDAAITCPDLPGADGKPLRATFTTPDKFEHAMRDHAAQAYSDFTWAFTRGAVKCEWTFVTLHDLQWTAPGKRPQWGCQPKPIADQLDKTLAPYRDAHIDMWVWCAGAPTPINAAAKQRLPGPGYGVSYTQWQLHGAYNLAIGAPDVPVVVHEINHRYLDNLATIEGVQLTRFHGLEALGYARGDLGYNELLATYRSVYLHVIRPAMWRRFTLTGPNPNTPEPFTGKLYDWADVSDDCWFRLPLLTAPELAQLTGLPSLGIVAPRTPNFRHFTVDAADRDKVTSPYADKTDIADTAPNNLLNVHGESCAVLRTATGTWLIVRPEVADVYAALPTFRDATAAPLQAAGWINDGVCPLVVFRAPNELNVPKREIDWFR